MCSPKSKLSKYISNETENIEEKNPERTQYCEIAQSVCVRAGSPKKKMLDGIHL